MNRNALLSRCVTSFRNPNNAVRETKLVGLEPLEDRKMLAVDISYVNDNWVNLDGPTLEKGDFVRSTNDAGTAIVAEYGEDAFGIVDGQSIAQYATIYSAVQNTNPNGTVNLLPGTFKESDIVISKSLTIKGTIVSGNRTSVIVPETASNKVDGNFPVGTHSAVIINAPKVTIDSLQIDGNGNNTALGGSLHYHHGITNIYDTQNGGDYATVRAGNVAPNNLVEHNESANVTIRNLDVKNTYWHGITLSGLSATNMRHNRIQNVNVENVGVSESRDLNRVGILLMNQRDSDVLSSTVSNTGVGIELSTFGPASFDSNELARNHAGMRLNTVTNAERRAYAMINADGAIDLSYILAAGEPFVGFNANKAIYTSTTNNGVGLYLNQSQTVVAGLETINAKIGMQVENTYVEDLRLPVVLGSTFQGPGTGIAGSVGILADNVGDPTNPASFGIAGATKISGFQTGLRMNQVTTDPPLSERNRAQIDRANLAGNQVAISVGSNSLLQGNTNMTDSVQLTGNGTIEPGFPDSFVLHEGPDDWAGPYADVFKTGSVTLNGTSTLDIQLAGQTGNRMMFDMNDNIGQLPFGTIPPPPEGGRTTDPYGSSFGNNTLANGVLTIRGDNGPISVSYGTLNHQDPTDPEWYILDPVDVSKNYSTLDVVLKLGNTNQAKAFIFGLTDTEGQVALFAMGTEGLSSTTYSTVSINLAAPGIPFSLGEDGDFDLNGVTGWALLGDVGLINGATNVPLHVIIEEVRAGSILNSQLDVTGTVSLANAKLNLQLREDFSPTIGQQFIIVNNDSTDPVDGTFAGIANGGTTVIGGHRYIVHYNGGDGNDVVVTYDGEDNSGPAAEIVGRYLFYNQSKFDGNTTGGGVQDDNAIASDKTALQFSGSTNAPVSAFSSYSLGINGIMVDIKNAAGTLTANDFTFKMGTSGTVNNWTTAPTPTVTSRQSPVDPNATRYELIWANNAIKNTWLQVIVEGNDSLGGNNTSTGLAQSDVFFFGSRLGAAFVDAQPAVVSTGLADTLGARNNRAFLQPITNVYDYDRDQTVGLSDELVARNNTGILTRNLTWNPPAAPLAAVADNDSGNDSGNAVASALAAKSTSSTLQVPGWISQRLASVNLNSGPVAKLFTTLAEANTPTTRSLLLAANEVTNALDLDDSLLESLIEGLG